MFYFRMKRSFDDIEFGHANSDTRLFEPEAFNHLAEVDFHSNDNDLVKSLVNKSSYLGKKLTTRTTVPASIHRVEFRDFWLNSIKPDQYVMDTISYGYKLPFISEPPESFEDNNVSAKNDMEFVREEVKRLESLNCIVKTEVCPKVVLPLSSVFS